MMKKLVSFTLVVVMVTVMMISVLTPLDYIVFAGTANTDTNTYTFDFSTDSPVVVINEEFITNMAQGCFGVLLHSSRFWSLSGFFFGCFPLSLCFMMKTV